MDKSNENQNQMRTKNTNNLNWEWFISARAKKILISEPIVQSEARQKLLNNCQTPNLKYQTVTQRSKQKKAGKYSEN